MELEEHFWAAALAEFDGPRRRMGLYAKAFSEAEGDETKAKALYLLLSAQAMQRSNDEALRLQREAATAAEEAAAYARAQSEAHAAAYASMPKGACPNCSTVVLLDAASCPRCRADFSANSLFKIQPLGPVVDV